MPPGSLPRITRRVPAAGLGPGVKPAARYGTGRADCIESLGTLSRLLTSMTAGVGATTSPMTDWCNRSVGRVYTMLQSRSHSWAKDLP